MIIDRTAQHRTQNTCNCEDRRDNRHEIPVLFRRDDDRGNNADHGRSPIRQSLETRGEQFCANQLLSLICSGRLGDSQLSHSTSSTTSYQEYREGQKSEEDHKLDAEDAAKLGIDDEET